jgi:flagellum-specific peptidoglycan hydrolase FlgJ
MTPYNFVKTYLPYARQIENETGLSAIAVLAQCALETGWGATVVGNMMFGVKDSDGINGNEQLLTTVEYLNYPNAKFPAIISVTKWSGNLYKYVVKAYFRKYKTPADSFRDHAELIRTRPHFADAWNARRDYKLFLTALQAGKLKYATGPEYASICISIGNTIASVIQKSQL